MTEARAREKLTDNKIESKFERTSDRCEKYVRLVTSGTAAASGEDRSVDRTRDSKRAARRPGAA